MRNLFLLFLVAGLALPAFADKDAAVAKVTVAQLEQTLAAAHGKPDADVARQLSGLELTERLNMAKLAALKADLPGDKARGQLTILADSAAFLAPPEAEIPATPAPDAAAARQMLTQVVNYVNTTVRQLPNLLAVRDTTGFEDKPQEDVVGAVGITTEAAMPLHAVGKTSITVTYRDHKEVEDEKAAKHGAQIGGLATSGEFGPVLGLVVGDALKGKITWGRWEQGANGKAAVFHYAVPSETSHYPVQFCCVTEGLNSDGTADRRVFREIVSYHGEFAFDPANGTIFRITMEADIPAGELVSGAGISVEYGPVEIAGKNYVCPVRSVSILRAHTAQQTGAVSRSNYKGAAKTYLNDVAFGQYRRFGSETRILSVDGPQPNTPPGPSTADAPYSPSSRAVTH
jgi:hypothetical protein